MAITNPQSPRPRITITREIVDRSIPKDSGHCAIADAIKAQIPEASAVTVDLATVRWTDRVAGLRYVWLTPVWAQQFLLAVDYAAPLDRWIDGTFRFGAAAQIVEIKAPSRRVASERAARRQELEARDAAGENLSSSERQALNRIRRERDKGVRGEDRPTTESPASLAYVGGQGKQTVKLGGKTPGSAVLAHGPGRRRQYGMRLAGVPDGVPAESPTLKD